MDVLGDCLCTFWLVFSAGKGRDPIVLDVEFLIYPAGLNSMTALLNLVFFCTFQLSNRATFVN